MSADNGIYIAQFDDGHYRVAYAMAIENIDYYADVTPEYNQTIVDYFGASPRFTRPDAAFKWAQQLYTTKYKNYSLEYGITELNGVYHWPGIWFNHNRVEK